MPKLNLLRASVMGALAAGMVAAPPLCARITDITYTTATAFGGHSFAGIGTFDRIVGTAKGELDATDPHNSVITDISLAGAAFRTATGKVMYSHNFYILVPTNRDNWNKKVMYEPPNRGGKTYQSLLRISAGGNDPGAVTDAAALDRSFLWPRGYATVWSGWEDLGVSLAGLTATASLPVAKFPGAPEGTITGPAYEYIVTGNAAFTLAYAANTASKDPSVAKLTHRVHLDDAPVMVDPSGWDYVNPTTRNQIKLTTGNFIANDIYEFAYIAKDPKVAGVGFAAVRDFNSFLRYATADDDGTANPLAGISRIYTEISSQPGRMLNDFRHLGFNEDESGRKVFDGLMQWVAAADGINMNYRFSQSGRTERNRQDHLYLEGLFPFANETMYDAISDTTDGRYAKCAATGTCPLAMEFYSSNEYWVKAASLFHTDPQGQSDAPGHPMARLYNLASKQHGGAGNRNNKGNCQQFQNPLDSAPVQRALWVVLDEWSTQGIAPPASQVPTFKTHTLVPPLPQSGVGFPSIPGVVYTGLKTTRYRLDYGTDFYTTYIATINPPVVTAPYQDNPANGPIYPSYVPTTDADGNEIAGIRLPELTAPLATYTGWSLRAGAQANDGCEGTGQYIAFPRTKADRLATGDPRQSVEERYPSYASYHSAVMRGIDDLVKNRFLLCEDTQEMFQRLIADGLAAGVPPQTGNAQLANTVPHCN
jgi:hypothetical protein